MAGTGGQDALGTGIRICERHEDVFGLARRDLNEPPVTFLARTYMTIRIGTVRMPFRWTRPSAVEQAGGLRTC